MKILVRFNEARWHLVWQICSWKGKSPGFVTDRSSCRKLVHWADKCSWLSQHLTCAWAITDYLIPAAVKGNTSHLPFSQLCWF